MINHPPISLLPICAKILERIIFNNMIEYFTETSLNSANFQDSDPVTLLISSIHNHEILRSGHLIFAFQLELYFRTFQKLLIEFGTKLLFSSCVKMVFIEIWLTFQRTF